MGFESIPGIEGKVFVPDEAPGERKHPCRDCFRCQQCSDDRCRVCRSDDDPAVSAPRPPKNRCRRCDDAARFP